MKAVFDTKPTSVYDDEVTRHYQFPRRYLGSDFSSKCEKPTGTPNQVFFSSLGAASGGERWLCRKAAQRRAAWQEFA
jgi:hypothetical protein